MYLLTDEGKVPIIKDWLVDTNFHEIGERSMQNIAGIAFHVS